MKLYSFHGVNEFIVCCGYKGYMIKEFFANYFLHMSDVTIDLKNNQTQVHHQKTEPWKVTLIDTGELTMTGGRLKRIAQHLEGEKTFCLTYGDGLSDINIKKLIGFHSEYGRLATVTAVYPPGRFGALELDSASVVTSFKEKPRGDGGLINGGFFVLSTEVLSLITDDQTILKQCIRNRLKSSVAHHIGLYFLH
jgi:glucose-1-phosphate cytidylyltransferase